MADVWEDTVDGAYCCWYRSAINSANVDSDIGSWVGKLWLVQKAASKFHDRLYAF